MNNILKERKIMSLFLILSQLFMLSACSGETVPKESAQSSDNGIKTVCEETTGTEETPFVPVFRALACSDVHVKIDGDSSSARLKRLFISAYSYADNNPDYKHVDAMIVAGDLTLSGYESEYKVWNDIVTKYKRDETTVIAVTGNHEFDQGGIEELNKEPDKHEVVKGFHIIGLSTRGGDIYTEEQFSWLEEQLASAAADDPQKPIFTFQHHHLKDTVYVSKTWYTSYSSRFKEIYGKYPQVINFSGHSHGPINNPLSIWQDNFTMLGTGTLYSFEMEADMTESTNTIDRDNAAQYYIIEVDSKNRVRILPYNLVTNDFFRTPSNTDDNNEQLVYEIDKPGDKSTFTYTAARGDNASAPYFPEGAEITVSNITYSGATIKFPVALDESCIYGYNAVFTASDGTETSFSSYARYYLEPMPENQSITIDGLKSGEKYTVALYPINVWGKTGKPLTASFETPEC